MTQCETGDRVESRIEITRIVSLLRSILRGEVEECDRAIRDGELRRARSEISEVHDRLGRAIYMLNRLR